MKKVVITGASGGIGRALVSRFTAAGWEVIACDRTNDGLRVDVTDEASVQAARQMVGVPDVLINNAGIGLLGPVAELPDEVLARQLDVNVRGVARMVRTFAPGMCARGAGRIINVSSLAGVTSLPWFGAYAASKHAVEALSDAMRLELEHAAPGSAWEGPLRNTLARRGAFLPITVTPDRVADAVFHAATSRFPRARYRVGWLASTLLRCSAFLPSALTDTILRAMVGFGSIARPLETR